MTKQHFNTAEGGHLTTPPIGPTMKKKEPEKKLKKFGIKSKKKELELVSGLVIYKSSGQLSLSLSLSLSCYFSISFSPSLSLLLLSRSYFPNIFCTSDVLPSTLELLNASISTVLLLFQMKKCHLLD